MSSPPNLSLTGTTILHPIQGPREAGPGVAGIQEVQSRKAEDNCVKWRWGGLRSRADK